MGKFSGWDRSLNPFRGKELIMSLDFSLEREVWHSYDRGKTWETDMEEVYTGNITHNLSRMAKEVGLYACLWGWEAHGKQAKEIVADLRQGLNKLKSDPDYYKQFDAPNGWGKYTNLASFVQEVLYYCTQHPDARIRISK